MEIKNLSPWNWFKNEQYNDREKTSSQSSGAQLPVRHYQLSSPFMRLHQEIDRLFDDAFRGLNFSMPAFFDREDFAGNIPMLRPAVDITEDKNCYSITVEVPGIEEKDIQIQLQEDALIIQGEKRQIQERKDVNFHRTERSFGSFQRVLALPQDSNPETVKASFKNGVITITVDRMPEKARKQPRMINLSSETASGAKLENKESATHSVG